jgi:hypothetical protein
LFERDHHRRIGKVLAALDHDVLRARHCLFGGGTAIALMFAEFRESIDIDFLVSDLAGYRELRQMCTGSTGIEPLFRVPSAAPQARDIRADQYGIRTMLKVDDALIKFEIVLEARIALDEPSSNDAICGVATLTRRDLVASKLLANSDRWGDDSAMSRDLIDLAMMQPSKALLVDATRKAGAAYGESVRTDLNRAIEGLRARPNRLGECMQALGITSLSKVMLWTRIRSLAKAVA